jgi:uncharacterized protein (TIGR03083 family)
MSAADQRIDPDFAAAYDAVRQRLAAEPLADHSTVAVTACPGWSVHDVVAHLAGLCEDWVGQRFDGYASDGWTATQVARFADRPMDEIFAAWSAAAVAFADLPEDTFVGRPARWAFGDAVVHEADLRGVTGLGRVPEEAVLLSLPGAIARWRGVLQEANAPTLLVRAPGGHEWWLGPRDAARDEAAVVVETPVYELFRALAGRRSTEQVREWTWSADPQAILDSGLAYPFSWATHPLVD